MKTPTMIFAGIIAISSYLIQCTSIVPYIELRSQGLNTPRHLVGVIQQLYTTQPTDLVHGAVSATLFYNSSFNTDIITQSLFGINNCESITIAGSQVSDRTTHDWLADYFYLPTDYKSHLTFNPTINNIGAELSLFVDPDEWVPGLYVTVYAPLVHSRWNLHMCETIDTPGTNTYTPGYFTPAALDRNDMFENFSQYIQGDSTGPVVQTVAGTTFTTTLGNLRNARIAPGELNQTRLADMRLYIGYDIIQKPRFYCGIEGIVVLPVGNRPDGEYLFDPIVGNGHHWELGAGLTSHAIIWQTDDEQNQMIFTFDAYITHLFNARQKRTYDLDGKPFSRYMLMERLTTPITDNLKGDGITPAAQFTKEFQPVANFSKIAVDVSAALQAEITALITLVYSNFSFDIGYNFWMRSCEHATIRDLNPFNNNISWALKGDASVYGFDRGATGSGPLVGAVPLSATQSNATISSTLNGASLLNPAIDNPTNSTGDAAAATADNPLSATPDSALISIKTSVEPIFIPSDALNVCNSPSTKGMTNKLFAHISYAYNERQGWIPFIGIGAEAEFHHANNSSCDSSGCSSCISCALSQWGIWLKGGLVF